MRSFGVLCIALAAFSFAGLGQAKNVRVELPANAAKIASDFHSMEALGAGVGLHDIRA